MNEKNFLPKIETSFKKGMSYIEHSDDAHKESLEKKSFNFEYQKKFSDFFLSVFKEVNIDPSYLLISDFKQPQSQEDMERKGAVYSSYISPTSRLHWAILPTEPYGRLFLDEKLEEEFKKRKTDGLSAKEVDALITEAYMKKVDYEKLITLFSNEKDLAKKNLLQLILQVINPSAIRENENEISVPHREPERLAGQCTMSERHMLAYISGQHIKPGKGYVNLILDKDGSPLMIEKIGLGDPHSCISLKPVRIDGRLIPAGAIFSAVPDIFEPVRSRFMRWFQKKEGALNYITNVKHYKGFAFIRMSILSVPEEIRSDACGSFYLYQQDRAKGYINYDWITPEILSQYAERRLKDDK
ncbi:MAG: hypothetical protein V4665_01775 [Patescibacteria group bacterium]